MDGFYEKGCPPDFPANAVNSVRCSVRPNLPLHFHVTFRVHYELVSFFSPRGSRWRSSLFSGLKTAGKSKQVLLERLSEYVAKHGRELPGASQRQHLRPCTPPQLSGQEEKSQTPKRSKRKRVESESADSYEPDDPFEGSRGGYLEPPTAPAAPHPFSPQPPASSPIRHRPALSATDTMADGGDLEPKDLRGSLPASPEAHPRLRSEKLGGGPSAIDPMQVDSVERPFSEADQTYRHEEDLTKAAQSGEHGAFYFDTSQGLPLFQEPLSSSSPEHEIHPALTGPAYYHLSASMAPRPLPQGSPPGVNNHPLQRMSLPQASATPNRVYLIPTASFPASAGSKDKPRAPSPHSDPGVSLSLPPQHLVFHSPQSTPNAVQPTAGPTKMFRNPFGLLQHFALGTAQSLPLENAISVVRHGEAYLGAIRERLLSFVERRSAQAQQQRVVAIQRRNSQQFAVAPPTDGGPPFKRQQYNEYTIDLPTESPLMPPRPVTMTIHVVYSSLFPRGSREVKLGNLNRSMFSLADAAPVVIEHDEALSALQSCEDGDVVLLVEGYHRFSIPIENKRIEVIGLATQSAVCIVPDDPSQQHPVASVGTSASVRFFNLSIVAKDMMVSTVYVGERTSQNQPRVFR